MNLDKNKIEEIVQNSILKADYKFEYPPICLQISGQYGDQIFSTLGNISVLLAPPKVGKTTVSGVVASALISGKHISNFKPSLPGDKSVIVWIDTEQAKPECIRVIKSICYQVNGDEMVHPENLIYLALRGQSKEVITSIIDYMVYNTANIGFMIIDGIRDLVTSINDEKDGAQIVEKLMKWTQEVNIHILTILHQNKADANARGHLGTELMNKAETVASLSKGENNGIRTTIIEPKFTRHRDFEPFAFTINPDGAITDSEIKVIYDAKTPKASQLTSNDITQILKRLFKNGETYTYGSLQNEIHKICDKDMFTEFGNNKCVDLIKRMKDENYIFQKDNSKEYHFNQYPF